MMRSAATAASSMQKTYNDAYLQCSTAVYFEKQNNEAEALRSWRSALDNIYYHNAYKMPASYRPKNETEKALQDSLHDMELQCKERVDLLEALRKSRIEVQSHDQTNTNGITNGPRFIRPQSNGSSSISGVIGDGTIPSVGYGDLARPSVPTRQVPSRPSYVSKKSSDGPRSRNPPQIALVTPPSVSSSMAPPPPPSLPKRSSRTPSPDKKSGMFRTTLRKEPKDGVRTLSARMTANMMLRPKPAASQAATLAWPSGSSLSGMGLSTTNESTISLAGSTNASYSRTSADGSGPGLSGFQNTGWVPRNNGSRPRSPADSTAPRRDANWEFPTRPKSREPAQISTRSPQHDGVDRQNVRNGNGTLHTPFSHPQPPPQAKYQERLSPTMDTDTQARHRIPLAPVLPVPNFPSYRAEYAKTQTIDPIKAQTMAALKHGRAKDETHVPSAANLSRSPARKQPPPVPRKAVPSPSTPSDSMSSPSKTHQQRHSDSAQSSSSEVDRAQSHRKSKKKEKEPQLLVELPADDLESAASDAAAWDTRVAHLMKNLPRGVDEGAAKAIFNEIVVKGDEVYWDDVAGLDIAKNALKEAVVYPFLRPDLFMGLREPARGMLLFGPPGTGKTMLARAVATESRSTFFAISASSLTSKYLGESEKLVRALFQLAKALAPSIIFVDEIDSLLSQRAGSGEHEATRRIKTEFLIQWSDLAKAAAGREQSETEKVQGDASRVLVLAATNLPWAIDEAARRRFVRRQYIPLPESHVRESQLRKLMSAQKHGLSQHDIAMLVVLTDGFSGSDITALAKDAAMGPLRSLGEKLLHMSPDEIRPILYQDFEASLVNIRPSVSKQGLKEYDDWAREFGERGG